MILETKCQPSSSCNLARRKGVAGWIMRRAAFWAAENGAHTISVLCTKANAPANTLYQRLGFAHVCGYHYRMHPEDI